MLSELHQRILGRDSGLAVRPAGRRPAARHARHPSARDRGIRGPRQELASLTGEQGGIPGIAVVEGMPGVGKTALAIRAARPVAAHYPDGMLYLNLHSHDPGSPSLDSAEALHRLLQMLTVPAAQIPDRSASGPPCGGPTPAAARPRDPGRRGRADQIGPLLPVLSQSLILITTRRRLPDFGGRSLTLDVLSVDEAITLFRRVIGERRATDAGQIAAVVELCGRLPLAIQLTAASRIAQDGPLERQRPDRRTVAVSGVAG